MRKMHTSLAVLTVSLLAVTSCHRTDDISVNISSTPSQKSINYANYNIAFEMKNLKQNYRNISENGDKASKLLHKLSQVIFDKYHLKTGQSPFDHSYARQQFLLEQEVLSIFQQGSLLPRFTASAEPRNIVDAFTTKWGPVFNLSRYEDYFSYNPGKGQDDRVIGSRVQSVIDDIRGVRVGLARLLNFDYTRFYKILWSLITQFWNSVGEIDKFARLCEELLLEIKEAVDSLQWE